MLIQCVFRSVVKSKSRRHSPRKTWMLIGPFVNAQVEYNLNPEGRGRLRTVPDTRYLFSTTDSNRYMIGYQGA